MTPRLSDLPDEILLAILSSYPFSTVDLHSLVLVNKRFSVLIPHFLYADIVFPFHQEDTQRIFQDEDVEGTDIASLLRLSNLSRTLTNPSLASLVQSFEMQEMRLHIDSDCSALLAEHTKLISERALGLQSLKLHHRLSYSEHDIPWSPWETDFLGGIPFHSLHSLHLGFPIPFSEFSNLFFLPNLGEIYVDSFKEHNCVDHFTVVSDRKPHTSQVTDFHLGYGSEFGGSSELKTVFSWPRRLEKFTGSVSIMGAYNPGRVAQQLEPAMKSLVHINIDASTDEYSSNPTNSVMSFDGYIHLQRLEISSCLLFQGPNGRAGLFTRLPQSLKELEIQFQEYEPIIRSSRENGDPNPNPRDSISPSVNAPLVAEDHLWIYELAVHKNTHLKNLTTIRMREDLSAEDGPNFSSHRWIPPKPVADLFLLNGIELDIRIRSYRGQR